MTPVSLLANVVKVVTNWKSNVNSSWHRLVFTKLVVLSVTQDGNAPFQIMSSIIFIAVTTYVSYIADVRKQLFLWNAEHTFTSFSCNTATGCIECNNSLISSPCIRNKMKKKRNENNNHGLIHVFPLHSVSSLFLLKVFPEFTPKFMESFL